MATMNVSIPEELAKLVEEKVRAGGYGSASEVVRASLRLMFAREAHLEWLRKEVRIGMDEIDRGEGIPFTPELFGRIKAEGRRRLAQKRKKSA